MSSISSVKKGKSISSCIRDQVSSWEVGANKTKPLVRASLSQDQMKSKPKRAKDKDGIVRQTPNAKNCYYYPMIVFPDARQILLHYDPAEGRFGRGPKASTITSLALGQVVGELWGFFLLTWYSEAIDGASY